MKLARKVGSTSEIWQVFVRDSSSTTGGGLAGLTNASSGLTAYYHRDTDTTATAISLVTMTVGTFTSSGFKEIDSSNMPGWYQFCPPNAALASGAKSCAVHLKGATNMAPLPIEVDLDAQVDVSKWNSTAVPPENTAGYPLVDTAKVAGTGQTARDLGASVLLSVGTGTGQVNLSSGKVPATLASTDVTGNVAADLQTIKTQSVTCAGGVTVPAATLASTTNITAGTITTVTTVTNQLTAAAIATGVWQDTTAGDFTTASSIGRSLFTSGVAPGAAGGLFIAGTNAATTITTALTTTFTGNLTGSVTVGTNNDKTGYSISGTKTTLDALNDITAAAVWAAGTRTLTASLDPTSAVIAAAVWDLATSGHTTSGTFGAAMNAAGSAGDPWSTALPGAYGSGTAGFLVGSNLNATVSSRSTYAGGDTSGTTTLLARLTSTRAGYIDNLSAGAVALAGSAPSWYTAPVDVSSNVSAIKAKTDNLPTAPADETLVIAATNAIMARLGAPAGASLAADIATRLATSGYTTPPTVAAIATGVWTDATAGDFTTTGTPGKILVGQLGGAFTTTTSSIYSTAALANAPSGGGGSVTVAGYAAGQDPATLVLDAAAASHDTAGTIGQKINAAGGAADPLTNTVPGSYASGTAGAALGRIGSGQITTTSIVGQSGDIGPLIQGDSYYAADGRAIDWTDRSAGWPDLTGATITVTFLPRSGSVTKTGSVVTAGGSAQKVRLELTATDTAALPLGGFPFHVTATLSSTRVATLVRGNVVVAQT